MKNNLKSSASMILILSSSLFASITQRQGIEQHVDTQVSDTIIKNGTPVYEGDKDHQVAILEKDYPQVAAGFSTTFPGASNQLWIKEGRLLFVYCSKATAAISAVFTMTGRMNYAIYNISMQDVPESIVGQVKIAYPFFSFFSGKKIEAGGNIAYELVYENSNEFITISTTDEAEIVATSKIRKATDQFKKTNNQK